MTIQGALSGLGSVGLFLGLGSSLNLRNEMYGKSKKNVTRCACEVEQSADIWIRVLPQVIAMCI